MFQIQHFVKKPKQLILLALCCLLTGTAIGQNITVIAHRGASGYAPENTLAAIKKALEMNADIIEIDVHLTKDDSVVAIHDNTLNRTTTGNGAINETTYEQIKTLDAGAWFSLEFKGEKVPILREVLQTINGQKMVLIELKWPKKGIYDSLPAQVLKTIKECGAEKWVIIQSFEFSYLETINRLNPAIPLHRLLYFLPANFSHFVDNKPHLKKFVPSPFEVSVNPSISHLKTKTVKRLQQSGRTVFTYTANSQKQIEKAIKLGVNGIITNYPDLVKYN